MSETLTLINGNKQPYTLGLPKIMILTDYINDIALEHIRENTGLTFVKTHLAYEAQPETALQIVALLMTYNYKTKHYNNWDYRNTLMLRSDYHVGFNVTSICKKCAEHNHLNTRDLNDDDRLAC